MAWHGRLAWRASRFGVLLALPGGFLLDLLLPVRGAWLPGLVGLGAALGAILSATFGREPLPPRDLDVGPALERVGAADQVAHGLFRAALVLGAFGLGLGLGGLLSGPLGLDYA